MEKIEENNNFKINEEFIINLQILGKSLENLVKEETKVIETINNISKCIESKKQEKYKVEITRTEDEKNVEYLCGSFDSLDELVTNIDKFVERMRPVGYKKRRNSDIVFI